MHKERLKELFKAYDPDVKNIILRVLDIEQENISMEKPRVKEQIDKIISDSANRYLADSLNRGADEV